MMAVRKTRQCALSLFRTSCARTSPGPHTFNTHTRSCACLTARRSREVGRIECRRLSSSWASERSYAHLCMHAEYACMLWVCVCWCWAQYILFRVAHGCERQNVKRICPWIRAHRNEYCVCVSLLDGGELDECVHHRTREFVHTLFRPSRPPFGIHPREHSAAHYGRFFIFKTTLPWFDRNNSSVHAMTWIGCSTVTMLYSSDSRVVKMFSFSCLQYIVSVELSFGFISTSPHLFRAYITGHMVTKICVYGKLYFWILYNKKKLRS